MAPKRTPESIQDVAQPRRTRRNRRPFHRKPDAGAGPDRFGGVVRNEQGSSIAKADDFAAQRPLRLNFGAGAQNQRFGRTACFDDEAVNATDPAFEIHRGDLIDALGEAGQGAQGIAFRNGVPDWDRFGLLQCWAG